ncbi:MAG: hypothetical protein ACUVR4_07930 [Anaerolineae bacterium]
MLTTQTRETNDVGQTRNVVGSASAQAPEATEVLQQLTTTLSRFHSFQDAVRGCLDPWDTTSLAVAEQSLERAWLAFSQLHANLQSRA